MGAKKISASLYTAFVVYIFQASILFRPWKDMVRQSVSKNTEATIVRNDAKDATQETTWGHFEEKTCGAVQT